MDSPLRPLPKLNDDDSLLADLSIADDDSFLNSPIASKHQHPLGLPPPSKAPRSIGLGNPSSSAPSSSQHSLPYRPSPQSSQHHSQTEIQHHSQPPRQPASAHKAPHPNSHSRTPSAEATEPQEAEDGATFSSRDEQLRTSLNELRRMNAVFDGFLSSLEASRGHAERLATKAAHSRALLAQYVTLMGQTHHTQELLLNTRWTGVKDDAAALEAAELARVRAQEEAEARAHAEAERLAQEEREAEERAAAAAAAAERAATRGRGGTARGRGGSTRGRVPSATGIPTRTARPGATAGTGGVRKYDHVQSSGYGPRRS